MSQGKDRDDVSVWVQEEYLLDTETFNGKPIVNINSKETIDASAVALLVSEPEDRWDYHGPDAVTFTHEDDYQYLYDSSIAPAVIKAFHGLLHFKDLALVDTLVLGRWGGRHTDSTDIKDFLELLIEHEASFTGLKALFIGCDTEDELEIHDIQLSKVGGLLNYFTQLEYFKVRGAPNQPNQSDEMLYLRLPAHLKTFFEEPIHHPSLRKLVIETADMDFQTIENLSKSQLPRLEHLELWFGAYHHDCTDKSEQREMYIHLKALLKNDFPSLRYLGLRNSVQANSFAKILASSPILEQLDKLDLSLGNLTKKGAKALSESPFIGNIKGKMTHEDHKANFGISLEESGLYEDSCYNIFVHE